MNPLLQPEYVISLGLCLCLLTGAAAWRSSAQTGRVLRVLLLILRTAAVVLVLVLLLNPGRWQPRNAGRERQCLVLIDRSASMAVQDAGAQTRWQAAVAAAGQLSKEMPSACPAQLFPFTDRAEEPIAQAKLDSLTPDGAASDVIEAVEGTLARHAGGRRDIVAIALLSDGRQIPPKPAESAGAGALALAVPIFALPLGGAVAPRDLSVEPIRRQVTAFAGQQFQIGARLANASLGDIRTTVELVDAKGQVLQTQTVALKDSTACDVLFTPPAVEETGRQAYTVRVPAWPGERSTGNNQTRITVAVFDQPIRVLFAEGTPHWDSKFLAQVLRDQANMVVTENYRISEGRYHQITSGETELLEGERSAFPPDLAALRGYDALVFGKGMEYFVDSGTAAHIVSFVRDHGGCVIFARACPWYREIPQIAGLAPVTWGRSLTRPGRWRPSEDGERLQLFGGRLPGRDASLWQALPELENLQACESVHGFANVLAECVRSGQDAARTEPLVVSRRFGRGMVVAVNAEQLWHWDFFAAEGRTKAVYQAFWPQLVEWALTSSEFLPGQEFSLRVTPAVVQVAEPFGVTVGWRGSATDRTTLPRLTILQDGRIRRRVHLSGATGNRAQLLRTAIALDEPGLYDLVLEDEQGSGTSASQVVDVRPFPGEENNLSADPSFLAGLVASTGGEICSSTEELLAALVSVSVPKETPTTHERAWVPAWDRGLVLATILVLLAAEWALNRRNALA